MTYRLKLRGRTYPVETLKECSDIFSAVRDQSGQGCSRFPNGKIFKGGKQIAYVSYNGRVWPGTTYVADVTPLYGITS